MMNLGFSLTATSDPEAAKPGVNLATAFFGLFLGVGVLVGCYAFIAGHEHVYNNTRDIPWGILISTYAFLAMTSTGLCVLAAVSHLYGGNKLAPTANRLVWGSLITIMGAFTCIGFELEGPHRMLLYNIISPNITSNIWWMGTLYGLAVGIMIVEFWLILTRQYKTAALVGIAGALAEIAANTCLGGVFATLPSRPFWYGGIVPMLFISSAIMQGAAAAIIFNYFATKIRGKELDETMNGAIQAAGKVMFFMLVMIVVATFWRLVPYYVGGTDNGRLAADALLSGPLSTNFKFFELSIGMIIPLILMIITKLKSPLMLVISAALVLLGMFFARYDMVVAGQMVPHYLGWDNLPNFLSYSPSVGEILVTLAGFGLIGVGFLQGERFFGKSLSDAGDHH